MKAIGPLVMEILRLAANAVVLVLGGYQISIAKYLRGSTPIYNLKEIG